MLTAPFISVLGPDPVHRSCVLNGLSYQQDAIQSFKGWQYACYYASHGDKPEPLYVHLSRRKLPSGAWEAIVFEDYAQSTDDGHNTVQFGICAGDGTIHLSYDHHCDQLRYRHSLDKIALYPEQAKWTSSAFTPTLDRLPGYVTTTSEFGYITYPRFGRLGNGNMFFSFRTGKAGLGDDHLYIYRANNGVYSRLGTHLTGVQNNPYVHGLDYRSGRLHVTWVYRGFVHYEGWDDPLDTKHKQHAGPNGGENNQDLCYAYSDDDGETWKNGPGTVIARLRNGESVVPSSAGITAFKIPKGSGLSNQEAQAVDHDGGVHVLNRDNRSGEQRWKHFYRSPEGLWMQHAIPAVDGSYGGKRGGLAISKTNDLYLILPDNKTPSLSILKAGKKDNYSKYELVWRGEGFAPTEPQVDIARLDEDNVLSIYTRKIAEGSEGKRDVVVVDFQL